ncbi:MAG: hypothetical protein SLAVMIC_00073 [uncultured marine phage]|uniref:Uncharacterized protein n=1 Tax=uncultured marine phage TaxID=707152 RepID=A0A8D9FPX6_9VIRU|nr:MAG: hypothetical protein SLAVMIC_00073 [uncultured marine phage]
MIKKFEKFNTGDTEESLRKSKDELFIRAVKFFADQVETICDKYNVYAESLTQTVLYDREGNEIDRGHPLYSEVSTISAQDALYDAENFLEEVGGSVQVWRYDDAGFVTQKGIDLGE